MSIVVDVFKAILTRFIFAGHGFVAIWRVTSIYSDTAYWYLSISLLVLAFEGIFTLTIKTNQEWRWFCPSVFLYLSSVVPSIWLLELFKLDRRLEQREGRECRFNATQLLVTNNSTEELSSFETIGMGIKIPVSLSAETWTTVIEQFLMLILIIGRWLLPKGDLTREQLSQLLLVYIGTAADIIEFFDSFKDEKIACNRVLCVIILSIWSWSLLQFTLVLTPKNKGKKGKVKVHEKKKSCAQTAKKVCCSVDVWSIVINIILQDAPFFIFRLLLILYYDIISYTNIFFICKNTLVIALQFYRLIVVQAEKHKGLKTAKGDSTSKPSSSSMVVRKRMPQSGSGEPGKSIRISRNSKTNTKNTKSPKRAVARLVREISEDDGTVYPSPAHSAAFLLHSESDSPLRQPLRGRRRSLSTGDLSATAELSAEIDSSPDRSTCFSVDPDGAAAESNLDPGIGDLEDSDFEADGLSNLEEEDRDAQEDLESQVSVELEYVNEDKDAASCDGKRRSKRYSGMDDSRSGNPTPLPRHSINFRPVPMPRKAASSSNQHTRSPSSRSLASRNSYQGQGLGAREKDKKRTTTTRQDTGYSTASSSTRESPGNGKKDPNQSARLATPSREFRDRENRRAVPRPRELRGLRPGSSRGSELQELHEMYELSSPARSSRSSRQGQKPKRKSTGRRDLSADFNEGGEGADGFRSGQYSSQA